MPRELADCRPTDKRRKLFRCQDRCQTPPNRTDHHRTRFRKNPRANSIVFSCGLSRSPLALESVTGAFAPGFHSSFFDAGRMVLMERK